jgi:hypothetical protein
MQFRVPQFIDMEDKIIGPLTLKQFGYVLGAGGLSYLIWKVVPIGFIAFMIIVPVASLFLSLAFLKINNRPFGDLLESAFSYYTGGKIFTWKQPGPKLVGNTHGEQALLETDRRNTIARIDQSKLHDLSLGLDVLDQEKSDEDLRRELAGDQFSVRETAHEVENVAPNPQADAK